MTPCETQRGKCNCLTLKAVHFEHFYGTNWAFIDIRYTTVHEKATKKTPFFHTAGNEKHNCIKRVRHCFIQTDNFTNHFRIAIKLYGAWNHVLKFLFVF